jgi:hypothetical protein
VNVNGPHSRRSGSSKPKKKSGHQQVKIIKNINNNNFIFNNPQIEIKNPQMLGGSFVQAQSFTGAMAMNAKNGPFGGGVPVIKDDNIVMAGSIPHGFMQTPTQPTNLMGRRLAD